MDSVRQSNLQIRFQRDENNTSLIMPLGDKIKRTEKPLTIGFQQGPYLTFTWKE